MKHWMNGEKPVAQMLDSGSSKDIADIAPTLAAKIVARRRELGWTQTQLAERAGLKQAAIARLEKSGVIPRIDTLHAVARAMGLKLDLVVDDRPAAI